VPTYLREMEEETLLMTQRLVRVIVLQVNLGKKSRGQYVKH
jgi:hypothetical protein